MPRFLFVVEQVSFHTCELTTGLFRQASMAVGNVFSRAASSEVGGVEGRGAKEDKFARPVSRESSRPASIRKVILSRAEDTGNDILATRTSFSDDADCVSIEISAGLHAHTQFLPSSAQTSNSVVGNGKGGVGGKDGGGMFHRKGASNVRVPIGVPAGVIPEGQRLLLLKTQDEGPKTPVLHIEPRRLGLKKAYQKPTIHTHTLTGGAAGSAIHMLKPKSSHGTGADELTKLQRELPSTLAPLKARSAPHKEHRHESKEHSPSSLEHDPLGRIQQGRLEPKGDSDVTNAHQLKKDQTCTNRQRRNGCDTL